MHPEEKGFLVPEFMEKYDNDDLFAIPRGKESFLNCYPKLDRTASDKYIIIILHIIIIYKLQVCIIQ